MKKLALLLLLQSFYFVSSAQDYPIIKDTLKQAGIYKTFAEFRDNKPSQKLEYKIVHETKDYFTGPWNDGVSLTSYRLDIPKEQGRDLGVIFGFSDGKRFFVINSENTDIWSPNYAHNSNFNKLEYVGRFCVYDAVDFATVQGATIPKEVVKIIDMSNGKMSVLTVARMKKMLADKPEILKRFKEQSEKYYHIKKYIIEYLKS